MDQLCYEYLLELPQFIYFPYIENLYYGTSNIRTIQFTQCNLYSSSSTCLEHLKTVKIEKFNEKKLNE